MKCAECTRAEIQRIIVLMPTFLYELTAPVSRVYMPKLVPGQNSLKNSGMGQLGCIAPLKKGLNYHIVTKYSAD